MTQLEGSPKRLKHISTRGLFGLFNHEIPIQQADRITIIHGPNGYGKTIVLRMIDSLLRGDLSLFGRIPFEIFALTFADNTVLEVSQSERVPSGHHTVDFANLEVCVRRHDGHALRPISGSIFMQSQAHKKLLAEADRYVPGPYLLEGHGWIDRDTGTSVSTDDILSLFSHRMPPALLDKLRDRAPALPREFHREVDVRFIRTQRLDTEIDESPPEHWFRERGAPASATRAKTRRELTVEQYSEDLALRIQRLQARYAGTSQERDRTFPRRILYPEERTLSKDELIARFTDIETNRSRLVELGFLDEERGGLGQPPEDALAQRADILSVYVGDVAEKFAVFANMAERLGLFLEIMNRRLRFKSIHVGDNKQLVVRSATGDMISPRDLSSGEQHEMVLLYELLFKVHGGGLVLIDEPELSLHVEWQNEYMNDLLRIVRLSQFDVIVATHSPMIIGPYWHLTAELAGPPVEGHRR